MLRLGLLPAILLLLLPGLVSAEAGEHPNILIITVDDMNADSVGAFGSPIDSTPNIDRLAAEGLRFRQAHVVVANCMPGRNTMWSGLYPHDHGVEGFYHLEEVDYRTLPDFAREAGYFTSLRGKVEHSVPTMPPAYDLVSHRELSDGDPPDHRDPGSFYETTKAAIDAAGSAAKPFCLLVNIKDPHKPFWKDGEPFPPSVTFRPDEVPVPGYLPDDQIVREELADYFNTVRRADDSVGQILRALDESGESDDTIVIFLSDHGMPLPFAKTQVYHASTWTPLIVRWPGVTEAGGTDETHMVSAIDLLPTLLDIIGQARPAIVKGRSFEPLLRGEGQEGRDHVFKEYNENFGQQFAPMRAVQTSRFLYIFNPWSNGTRSFGTATNNTRTWRRMQELAASDASLAARVSLLRHRVPEELYDVENDPDCLINLVGDPAYSDTLDSLRIKLENHLRESGDHALEAWLARNDREAVEAYLSRKQDQSRRDHKSANWR